MDTTLLSLYIPMRDGVRLAVDAHIPAGPGPFPTVIHQTRYCRSIAVGRRALRALEPHLDQVHNTRQRFNDAGYVWLNVDVRGSGASTGVRPCPWSPDEVADGASVVDWVIAQPWSNGLVGATGISYGGTTAEMLLINAHPAVRAIAPRFSLFDVYTDVMAPGGIPLTWFTRYWNQLNQSFDRDQYHDVLGLVARIVLQGALAGSNDPRMPDWCRRLGALDRKGLERFASTLGRALRAGVRGADPDGKRHSVKDAVREHQANYDVHRSAAHIVYRDDVAPGTEQYDGLKPWSDIAGSAGRFSPHSYQDAIRASGAAIFSISGWLDGAYQHAAIKRHLTTGNPGSMLLLGPWEHGGHLHVSPYAPTRRSGYDHEGQLLAFFDHHLKSGPAPDVAPVRYYTIGAERWRSAPCWPPPGLHNEDLYLTDDRQLHTTAPKHPPRAQTIDLPTDATTGACSRWRSYIGPHTYIGYPDRTRQSRPLPAYRSAPLNRAVTLTGHPAVTLHISTQQPDGDLFVYLEEEDPSGHITYITEGMLRLQHRTLAPAGAAPYNTPAPYRTFERHHASPMPLDTPTEVVLDMLPVSYQVRSGSRIRLSLAGADLDNFGAPMPLGDIGLWSGASHPSRLTLPIEEGSLKTP